MSNSPPTTGQLLDLLERIRRPGATQICDCSEINAAPDGGVAAFTGLRVVDPSSPMQARICEVDLHTREVRVLTSGPHTDRLPRYSPDGNLIAFLSDHQTVGDFQLQLLDRESLRSWSVPVAEGWVEYLEWSPDGRRILLTVAGHGAHLASVDGAVASARKDRELSARDPEVEMGGEPFRWRRIYLFDIRDGSLHRASPDGMNVWEATWCGNDGIAAVASSTPEEGAWYQARIRYISLGGSDRIVYSPVEAQVGAVAGSPSGKWIAVAEGLASDRRLVAGDLRLIDPASGSCSRISTECVDVTYLEWRSETRLLIAGHRGLETVIAIYDVQAGSLRVLWQSEVLTAGGRYASLSGFGVNGSCVFISEGFFTSPTIGLLRDGRFSAVRSWDAGYETEARKSFSAQITTWKADDGLELQGWLLLPATVGSFPLATFVHGGPVWHWRTAWLGRGAAAKLFLLQRGYSIFLPNPRGSSGRGQRFARLVLGDMGGADAQDCVSGIDSLVKSGIADGASLVISGLSYGGYMTSWLISQDARFRAAVAVSPHTNHVTYKWLSNIPEFMSLFAGTDYTEGAYLKRSPITYANCVKTPILNVCGALDLCTPPSEAQQFHNAVRAYGTESIFVKYPQEGHGIRNISAEIDFTLRMTDWFDSHLSRSKESELFAASSS